MAAQRLNCQAAVLGQQVDVFGLVEMERLDFWPAALAAETAAAVTVAAAVVLVLPARFSVVKKMARPTGTGKSRSSEES